MFSLSKIVFIIVTCTVFSNVVAYGSSNENPRAVDLGSEVRLHSREFDILTRQGKTCGDIKSDCIKEAQATGGSSQQKTIEQCNAICTKSIEKRGLWKPSKKDKAKDKEAKDKAAKEAAKNGKAGSSSQQEVKADEECAICHDDPCKVPKRLKCGDTFCKECINTWFAREDEASPIHIKNTCPKCRVTEETGYTLDSD